MYYIINDQVVSKNFIEIDIYSPFLNYGQGLKRTMLYHDGHILWYEEHLKQLEADARELEFEVDLQVFSKEKILSLLEKNDLAQDTALIKILCIKEVAGCNTAVLVHPYQLPEYYASVALHDEACLSHYNSFSNIWDAQHVYWLEYYGRTLGTDQVLFINHKGRIIHAFDANVIALWNKNLYFVYPRGNFRLSIIQQKIIRNALGLGIRKLLDKGNGLSIDLMQRADEVILINDTFIAQTVSAIYRPSGKIINLRQNRFAAREKNFSQILRDFFLKKQ